jgi:hypothetical protein
MNKLKLSTLSKLQEEVAAYYDVLQQRTLSHLISVSL